MRKIHIVEKYHSYAMQRQTLPLMDLIGCEVTRGEEIDPQADVNIHMPWHFLSGYDPAESESKHIAVFTHENPDSASAMYNTCKKADFVTVLSFEMRSRLIALGIDPRKIRVAYCGTDQTQFRRRRVGIVATRQPNGRKRMNLLLDLAWKMDRFWLGLIEFCIIGKGWEAWAQELKNAGLNIVLVDGINDDNQMMQFYHTFDVLLSTAYMEGGSLPIIEAMKSGVKVLTPDYGYAHDLLTPADKYTTVEDLEKKLISLFEHEVENAQIATMLTWQSYAEEYALILNDLLDSDIREMEDSGTPRYAQLLRIVAERKPKNIIEVGTWAGKRASQMIQRAAGYRPIETINYLGFDLFEEMTENLFREELSKIPPPMEVAERFLTATGAKIKLVKGNSAVTIPKENWDYKKADLIFIDGGHRADTIRLDWENVQQYINQDTRIVFDDYYLSLGQHLDGYGCNELMDELKDDPKWEVIIYQGQATRHKYGEAEAIIALAEVRYA